MKTTISTHDLELISAFLDGQLDARQKAELDKRLQAEPRLKQTLNDLRQTRLLLRSAPKMKAPRSFKLRPEMVEARRPRPLLFPTFQFASAIAGLALVVVFLADFFGLGSRFYQPAMTGGAAPQVAMAPAQNSTAAQDRSAQKQSVPEATANAAAGIMAESSPSATPEGKGPQMLMAQPVITATNTISGGLPEAAFLPGETITETTPYSSEMTANSIPETELPPAAPLANAPEPPVNPPQARIEATFWSPLRVAEASLASLALVLGLAAVLLRRAGR